MKKRIMIIISIIVFIILLLGITKVLVDFFNTTPGNIILEGYTYNNTTLENRDRIEEENDRKEFLNEMIKIN